MSKYERVGSAEDDLEIGIEGSNLSVEAGDLTEEDLKFIEEIQSPTPPSNSIGSIVFWFATNIFSSISIVMINKWFL